MCIMKSFTVKRNLLLLFLQIMYYVKMLKFALIYFSTLLILFFVVIVGFANTTITIEKFADFLTLNYTPANVAEAVALIIMFLVQTSPIMAFVEVRTMGIDEKMSLMAGKMKDHIIVVGLGHLGRRIVNTLLKLDIPFVVITLSDSSQRDLTKELIGKGIPVIFGDATSREILSKAGIKKAHAIVIAFNNDVLNPVVAQRAKELNPDIKVVARVYWDEIAEILLRSKYAEEVLSSTAIAVPKYILGCYFDIDMEIPPAIPIKFQENSKIIGKKITELEQMIQIHVLGIVRKGLLIKDRNETIHPEDTIIFWGNIEEFKRLLKEFSE